MPPATIPALLNEALRLHQAGRLEQAAALYNQVLATDPGQPDALHLLGMIALQSGRPEAGEALIRKAIARNGREAQFHFHLAFALQAQGQPGEAEASYRRALVLKPNDPDTYNNLGNVLAAQHKHEEAAASFRRALALAPDNAGAHNNLGSLLWTLGQRQDAEAHYRKAVALKPDYADALINLGNLLRDSGDMDQAMASYRQALAASPNSAALHSNLGVAQWHMGQRDAAMTSYRKALALDPDMAEALANLGVALGEKGALEEAAPMLSRAFALRPQDAEIANNLAALLMAAGQGGAAMDIIHRSLAIKETRRAKRMFVELVGQSSWSAVNDDVRAAIIRALTEPWDRPGKLAHVSAGLIKLGVAGPAVARANAAWPGRLPAATLLGETGFAVLGCDALLVALLTSAPNTDMELERFLTLARTALDDADDTAMAFAAALAQQCFINEYVFLPDADEEAKADALAQALSAALEKGETIAPLALVRLACYRPLHSLPHAEKLLSRSWPEAVEQVLTQQLREPLEEKRLAAHMLRLTAIADGVSRKVRDQYEENPYPRWVRVAGGMKDSIVHALSEKFPLAQFARQPGRAMNRLLVAGCGTGQHSISSALKYGDAGMLAVDLSLASLSYAKRKSDELGLAITYGQADILELGALERRFDVIESLGVLHHMHDPFAGWRALLALLEPGGFMWLGFYSQIARARVVEARGRIAERGLGSSPDEIRRFRQTLYDGDADGAFQPVLKSEDFFSVSACRDLIFHAQEHRLTLPQIAGFLKENNLTFLGFELDDAVLNAYRRRYPHDPAATDLANWAAFEAENPGMFAAMYVFWIQKGTQRKA